MEAATYVLDFLEESLLDETLVEKKGVIVDDIDKVGARGRSARPCELLLLGRVLSSQSHSSVQLRYLQSCHTYPESDLVHPDALVDEIFCEAGPVEELRLSVLEACGLRGIGVHSANIPEDLMKFAKRVRSLPPFGLVLYVLRLYEAEYHRHDRPWWARRARQCGEP